MSELLLSFYGDDFTGSTDVLEALSINGVPTVLFLNTPTLEQVRTQFPEVRAVGIAGVSRSLTPAQMDAQLPPKLTALKALQAPITHYKVCSTFDSSPELGSIGHAVDLGCDIFHPSFVPLLVGAPQLKRYVVFGNLFATVGDRTFRLDRHPTMSRHPATPMAESDLAFHLQAQSPRRSHSIDLKALSTSRESLLGQIQALKQDEAPFVIFDTLGPAELATIGELLDSLSTGAPLFVVGSSGVEYALADAWLKQGKISAPHKKNTPIPIEQLVVMSGSASPVNERQIQMAFAQGAIGQRLEAHLLVDPSKADQERKSAIKQALLHLASGRSLVLYTVLGPDDPSIEKTISQIAQLGLSAEGTSKILGREQGLILNALIEHGGLKRVCVAGGDTSGYVAATMEIEALEFIASVATGAPLCRVSSRIPSNDGIEIAFKGGQNGSDDYFEILRRGV